jgi:hypothetical protein
VTTPSPQAIGDANHPPLADSLAPDKRIDSTTTAAVANLSLEGLAVKPKFAFRQLSHPNRHGYYLNR